MTCLNVKVIQINHDFEENFKEYQDFQRVTDFLRILFFELKKRRNFFLDFKQTMTLWNMSCLARMFALVFRFGWWGWLWWSGDGDSFKEEGVSYVRKMCENEGFRMVLVLAGDAVDCIII